MNVNSEAWHEDLKKCVREVFEDFTSNFLSKEFDQLGKRLEVAIKQEATKGRSFGSCVSRAGAASMAVRSEQTVSSQQSIQSGVSELMFRHPKRFSMISMPERQPILDSSLKGWRTSSGKSVRLNLTDSWSTYAPLNVTDSRSSLAKVKERCDSRSSEASLVADSVKTSELKHRQSMLLSERLAQRHDSHARMSAECDEETRSTLNTNQRRLSSELFADAIPHFDDEPGGKIEEFVASPTFAYSVATLIALNAMLIGIQTDYMAKKWIADTPQVFLVFDSLFCCLFMVELAFRIYVHGLSFFCVLGWQWNMLDCVTVCLQVADVSMEWNKSQIHGVRIGIIRIVRVFRLFRVFRMVRLLSMFSELRMFIICVGNSMRSLLWTVIMIFLIVYVCGVGITEVVTDVKIRAKMQHDHPLLALYGSLGISMLTLYETISEGRPWSEAMEPLSAECSSLVALVFPLYIAFTVFALLNVITGVFVDTALSTAIDDKNKLLMYQLQMFLEQTDVDESGTITWREFSSQLRNPHLERFLKAVDLDAQESWNLFQLIDIDGSGEVSIEDFVCGFMRVTGNAKAIDLVTFMHQWKVTTARVSHEIEELTHYILEVQSSLEQLLVRGSCT